MARPGSSRHGRARLGDAWQGKAGDLQGGWPPAGFDSRPPARGIAGRGMTLSRHDIAGQCQAWRGKSGNQQRDGKMPKPFESLSERARWCIVYDMLKAQPVNGLLTYEEMGDALGLHPARDRGVIQQAMSRAAREHERLDKRAVDVVPNEGYRVVEATEHIGLARRQQRRSSRALVRGHSKAVNVDLNGVDPEVRKALEVIGHAFTLQIDFNRRFEGKQARLEQAVREIADSQEHERKRTDEELAELRERLARLESGQ